MNSCYYCGAAPNSTGICAMCAKKVQPYQTVRAASTLDGAVAGGPACTQDFLSQKFQAALLTVKGEEAQTALGCLWTMITGKPLGGAEDIEDEPAPDPSKGYQGD